MWVESKADAHCSICLCLAHSCKSPRSLTNSLVALGNLLCLSELWDKEMYNSCAL